MDGPLAYLLTTMLSTLFISLIASALGTFLGNLALLVLIGKKAEEAEKVRMKQLQEGHKAWVEALKKEQERLKEYARLES